jgi:hypothetical protein
VLYDAKNNKKSPGNSTSLPREARLEQRLLGPPPLPSQARPSSGRRPSAVQISIIKKVFYHD